MRDLPWPARFDGAFCVGNSFGYLDDEGNAAFLRAVAAVLKPGGTVCPRDADGPRESARASPGTALVEGRRDVPAGAGIGSDHTRSRLDISTRFLSNGCFEVRHGSHRAYRYAELYQLMEGIGIRCVRRHAMDARRAHRDVHRDSTIMPVIVSDCHTTWSNDVPPFPVITIRVGDGAPPPWGNRRGNTVISIEDRRG